MNQKPEIVTRQQVEDRFEKASEKISEKIYGFATDLFNRYSALKDNAVRTGFGINEEQVSIKILLSQEEAKPGWASNKGDLAYSEIHDYFKRQGLLPPHSDEKNKIDVMRATAPGTDGLPDQRFLTISTLTREQSDKFFNFINQDSEERKTKQGIISITISNTERFHGLSSVPLSYGTREWRDKHPFNALTFAFDLAITPVINAVESVMSPILWGWNKYHASEFHRYADNRLSGQTAEEALANASNPALIHDR